MVKVKNKPEVRKVLLPNGIKQEYLEKVEKRSSKQSQQKEFRK